MPVRIEGARTLRRTLRHAGVSAKDMRAANRAAGRIVADAAKGTAPKRSGRLARSVRPAGSTPSYAVVSAGTNGRVPYAGPIHWGWPARNIPAQPWLSDTARATEPVWITEYINHMRRLAESVRGA